MTKKPKTEKGGSVFAGGNTAWWTHWHGGSWFPTGKIFHGLFFTLQIFYG
jgi:hypothetical protein